MGDVIWGERRRVNGKVWMANAWHHVRRTWMLLVRWRWFPVGMAWAGVAGAWLMSGAYIAWTMAAFGAEEHLKDPMQVFVVFPETRWPFVAGAFLLGVGTAAGPVLAMRRSAVRVRAGTWLLVTATLWMAGLGLRSIARAMFPGNPLWVAWKSLWVALDARGAWWQAVVDLSRGIYLVLRPQVFGVFAAHWVADTFSRHGIPWYVGLIGWAAGYGAFVAAPLVNRKVWRYLVWAPEVQPPVHTAWSKGEPPDQTALRPHRPDEHAFDSLVGMDEPIGILKAQVQAWLRHQEAAWFGVRPAKGILLHGPPGTGKTSLARAAASYFGVNFLVAGTADLLGSGYVGETEHRVRWVFEQARRLAPCVVFLDEIDAVGMRRDGQHRNRPSDLVLPVLLQELDGFDPLKGVLVIAATNRVDVLDEALLRRFTYRIEVGLPDDAGRETLLRRFLRGVPVELDFRRAAERLKGFSPADLENVCEVAKQIVWGEYTQTGERRALAWSDLARALLATKGGSPEAAKPGWTPAANL